MTPDLGARGAGALLRRPEALPDRRSGGGYRDPWSIQAAGRVPRRPGPGHPAPGPATKTRAMADFRSASDGAIVVGIARCQEPALAEAYRRHGGSVHTLARRVLRSTTLADEVTQEVFVELWRAPERFDPGRGALRTFLMTKAHSRSIDVLRSESSRRAREERTVRETAAAGYDIEHHAWDLAVADRVKEAVDTLPPDERTAIEMAYFGGHTYREVASLLGEPEGTVKSRIRSGLRRLRALMVQSGVESAWTEP